MIMYYTWLCSFIPMLTALVIRISCIEVKNGDLYFSSDGHPGMGGHGLQNSSAYGKCVFLAYMDCECWFGDICMQRTIQRGADTNPGILYLKHMLRSICALGFCM